jgi:hypothetical protein
LVEIKGALAESGIEAGHISTVWSTLRRLGLSHKNVWPAPSARWSMKVDGSKYPALTAVGLGSRVQASQSERAFYGSFGRSVGFPLMLP